MRPATTLLAALLAGACAAPDADPTGPEGTPAAETSAPTAPAFAPGAWVPLFNGRDLDGWTPKFRGAPLGENVKDTFRVQDGLLTVSYGNYEAFDQTFGHLFFDGVFSSYDIKAVYRFVGEQCPGAPGWARRNNGLMLHGQAPETMALDQSFPVSVEAQMLGQSEGGGERRNGSVCTPGTNVVLAGSLDTRHCIESAGPTNRGEGWVEYLVEVRGHGAIRHFVNGELVLEYAGARLDPNDADAQALLAAGAPEELDRGTISIQAESHPIQFRSIELRVVDGQ